MQSLLIVDDGHLHRLGEGVLAQGAFVAVVDAGFAINHVDPIDHHHEYEVDTVAVHAV